jgi:cysteine desulfurase
VLQTARQLRDFYGFDLTILPVDDYGRVRPADVEAALRHDTALITIMAANNEIGTVQLWTEIGALARERGVLYHTDAVQLVPWRRWNLAAEPIDLMTIAPHKFYGPKGIGILIAQPDIELAPTQTGGGQEDGRRAGTLNVPLIVGAAEALRLAMADLAERTAHVRDLRDQLLAGVTAALGDECVVTGHPTERLPNHASFALRGFSGNDLLMHLDVAGIAAGSGSACSSGDPKPSAVLEAVGLGSEWTTGGLRLTTGVQNTAADVDSVLRVLPEVVQALRLFAGDLMAAPV